MKTERQFSIRIADGTEQTFRTALEMAEWIEHQRALEYRQRPRRRQGKAKTVQNRTPNFIKEEVTCGGPLAKFARRR
jgi:hypothetical protein